MKMIGVAILMVIGWCSWAQTAPLVIDYGKSSLKFKIKNAGIGVDGNFTDYSVTLQFDPKNLAASHAECRIKTTSINTGINARDNHLRKEEFFYVEKYPLIGFSSTSFKQQGTGYVIYGKLTIKEVTKEVAIPFTVAKSGATEIIEGNLTIDRLTFHVGENSWVMSDDVVITIKLVSK